MGRISAVSDTALAAAAREAGGVGESAPARPSLGRIRVRDANLRADGRAEADCRQQMPGPIRRDCRDCPLRANEQMVYSAYTPISANVGSSELKTFWQDPDFDPQADAFYYVRGLENPSCRWSTWDAIRAGEQPRSGLHKTIQQRVWSSPIWVRPAA